MTPTQLQCGLKQRLCFDRKSASYQRTRVPSETQYIASHLRGLSRILEEVYGAAAMHGRSRF